MNVFKRETYTCNLSVAELRQVMKLEEHESPCHYQLIGVHTLNQGEDKTIQFVWERSVK